MIDSLFSTTVYHVDLEPTTEVHDGMVQYIDRFYYKNIQHLGFAPSFTGEILGDSQISSKPEFKWIKDSSELEEINALCFRISSNVYVFREFQSFGRESI